jgi:hypothetical protein
MHFSVPSRALSNGSGNRTQTEKEIAMKNLQNGLKGMEHEAYTISCPPVSVVPDLRDSCAAIVQDRLGLTRADHDLHQGGANRAAELETVDLIVG